VPIRPKTIQSKPAKSPQAAGAYASATPLRATISTLLLATFEDNLGGRLALLSPDKLDSDQKALYDHLQATTVPWANKSGFQADTHGGHLIGPFNAMLRSPLISQVVQAVTTTESQETSLGKKVREVVILTVGAVWQCAYELYAHAAVAESVGHDAATVQALAAGQKPASLHQEESVAYDFTHRLATTHHIEAALYEQAIATFGEQGVVNMIYLASQYMMVSGMLNTFAVPAPLAQ
jgi:4-carboxymuconolactone decarboxylase